MALNVAAVPAGVDPVELVRRYERFAPTGGSAGVAHRKPARFSGLALNPRPGAILVRAWFVDS
jgi:hypothetical protein